MAPQVPRLRFADPLLNFRLHRLPPPAVALALRLKLRIAAGMKGIFSDPQAQSCSNEHIGCPVIPRHKACEGHGEGSSVAQNPRPGLGILVRQHRRHRPGEHGMPAGERGVYGVMLEKVAVTVTLPGTLAPK